VDGSDSRDVDDEQIEIVFFAVDSPVHNDRLKPPYVRDLQPNEIVTSVFLVQSKDIRQKKSGDPYLSLLVGDRTGDVEAKMWDNVADVMHTFERDDFIRLKGLYQIFQNRPQITVHKLMRVDDADVNFADFFPASERDPDEMFAELGGVVASVANPHLRGLLESILADDRIARAYKLAPAAKQIHHAYLSGLLEHVLSLCKLASMVAPHYQGVDRDLVIAGCILHDLGKIDELTYDRGFSYSSEGQLLGHIVIGLRIIEDKLRAIPDFPPKLRTLLEHLILSHHGELEYGSPKLPLFPEALLLHQLDNHDSKMECMRSTTDRDRHVEGCWTSFSPALDRAVLKKVKFLEETGTAAPPAIPAAAPVPPPSPAPARSPEAAGRSPASPPPPPPPALTPEAASFFGDKLKQALKT
jgi:3'-5' exoribonuclease